MKKVTILNFSGRNNGNCVSIADQIEIFYANADVCSFHINAQFSACGGCDYECLKPNVRCPKATEFQAEVMDAVCNSDLVYFIVPNYCGLPCSNYFAFNERSVGYFNMNRDLMQQYMSVKKKFIIVSNTESEYFVQAMRQQTNQEPEILYLKTGKYGKKSIAGDIMESEAAAADLKRFLQQPAL